MDSSAICRLPVYLLVRPHLAGRVVVDLSGTSDLSAGASRRALLHQAAPRRVLVAASDGATADGGGRPSTAGQPAATTAEARLEPAQLPLATASVDVVIGVDLLERDADPRIALREVARVLGADGFTVLVVRNREREVVGDGGGEGLSFWELRELLDSCFEHAAVLSQSPLTAFYLSYLEPSVAAEELTLLDGLLEQPEEPSHFIAVAGRGELPALEPYALASLPYYRLLDAITERDRQRRRRIAALEQRIRRLEAELAERTSELLVLAGRSARSEGLAEQLAESERALGVRHEELAELSQRAEQLSAKLREERERAAGLRQQIEDAELAKRRLQQRADQAEIAATELALDRDRIAARADELVVSQSELQRQYTFQAERLAEAERELDRMHADEGGSAAELARRQRRNEELQQQLDALEDRIAKLILDRDRLREELLGEEEQAQQLRLEYARVDQQRAAARKQVLELRAKLEQSYELERDLAGVRIELNRLTAADAVLKRELAELHQARSELLERLDRAQQQADERASQQAAERAQLEREAKRSAEQLARERERASQLERQLRELREQRLEDSAGEDQQRLLLEQLEANEAELSALREQLERTEQGAQQHEQQLRRRELELQEAKERHAESSGREKRLQQELEETWQRLAAVEHEVEAQRATLQERDRVILHLEGVSARERRELFQLEHAVANARQELQERQRAHQTSLEEQEQRARQQREQQRQEHAEALRELEAQVARLERENDIRAGEQVVALGRIEELEAQLWKASDAATRHAARLEAARTAVEREREQHQSVRAEAAALQEERDDLHKQLRELERLHRERRDQSEALTRRLQARLRELEGERKGEQDDAEELREQLNEARKQLRETRQLMASARSEATTSYKELEQRSLDAEAARQRAQMRAARADKLRREAERELGRLRTVVRGLGGDRRGRSDGAEQPSGGEEQGDELTGDFDSEQVTSPGLRIDDLGLDERAAESRAEAGPVDPAAPQSGPSPPRRRPAPRARRSAARDAAGVPAASNGAGEGGDEDDRDSGSKSAADVDGERADSGDDAAPRSSGWLDDVITRDAEDPAAEPASGEDASRARGRSVVGMKTSTRLVAITDETQVENGVGERPGAGRQDEAGSDDNS